MVKDKGFIILDPIKDKDIFPIFNELKTKQVVPKIIEDKEKWRLASAKIGRRCKHLIDFEEPENGLFYPPSVSRSSNMGFIQRPLSVDVEIIDFRKLKKIIFSRKIF